MHRLKTFLFKYYPLNFTSLSVFNGQETVVKINPKNIFAI